MSVQKLSEAVIAALTDAGYVQDDDGRWVLPTQESATQNILPIDGLHIVEGLCESFEGLAEVTDPHFEAAVATATEPNPPLVATLIKAGLNLRKSHRYTPEFLKRCSAEGKFTNAFGYLNHPGRMEHQNRPERDMAKLATRTGDAFWDEGSQSVKAALHFIAEDRVGTAGHLAQGLFADPVVRAQAGLSIWYPDQVEMKEEQMAEASGRTVKVPVRLITPRKFDIDIVTQPGAGGALPPLLESNRDTDDIGGDASMGTETEGLTMETLKTEHPELHKAAVADGHAAATAEFEAAAEAAAAEATQAGATDEPPEDTPETTDMDTAVAEAVAPLTARLAMLEQAQWQEELLAEAGLPEKAAASIKRRMNGKTLTAEEYKADFDREVEEWKAVIEESASDAAPSRITGLGSAPPETAEGAPATAADILREAKVHFHGDEEVSG